MNWIFWFRQDLRTFDNTWLIRAIQESGRLLCIFILDQNIIDGFGGLSDKKFLFIKEALLALDIQLKNHGLGLQVYLDTPENLFPQLIQQYDIDTIYCNTSYGTYGKNRDEKVLEICSNHSIDFLQENDFLLVEPEEVEQRKVFTPFYKLWTKQLQNKSIKLLDCPDWVLIPTDFNIKEFLDDIIQWESHPYFQLWFWEKRRKEFWFGNYEEERNNLDRDGTSKLAPYLRFWIYSVRDIYLQVKDVSPTYVSELAWREFWQHIAYYFPFVKKYEFQEKRRAIRWQNDEQLFEKWCKWETGYPVVDAAMKQLLETNWMHGRARMIVASFLTKDLHIDWKWWEKFFKKHLLDYDENVNIGNWQWSASVWADPKPLRIFNPCLQSEKFDPKAKFITKYLPELQTEDIKKIHNPIDNTLNYISIIVDHKIAQKEAREMYRTQNNT